MKKRAALVAACLMAFSTAAFPSGTVTNATITGVTMFGSIGDVLFVNTNQTVGTPASCSTNSSFQFVVSLSNATGQQMMALLLAARAAQAPVQISGTGTCSVYGNVETINVATY